MKELIFDLIGIIGVVLSFVGILLTLYANQKIRASKLLTFDTIKIACKSIAKEIKKNNVYPDVIIAQSPEAGLIGRILLSELDIADCQGSFQ